jgi:hypothetical protein
MKKKLGFLNLENVGAVRAGRGSAWLLAASMVLAALFCPVAIAQIAVDNVTIEGNPDDSTGDNLGIGHASAVFTYSHTIGIGSGRILVVGTSAEAIGDSYDTVVTSITYDGVAMIEVDSAVATVSFGMLTTLYYLLDADLPSLAGAYDVVVTHSADLESMGSAAISLVNVGQQPPEAVATGQNSALFEIETNITTLSENAWLVVVAGAGDFDVNFQSQLIGDPGVGDLQIQAELPTGGLTLAVATKEVATPGLETIAWSDPSPNRFAQVIVSLTTLPPTPSTFSITPVGGTALVGSSHTFEVELSNPVDPSYQWMRDIGSGAENVGTDQSTLTLMNLLEADSGDYWVVVTDDGGPFTTDLVTLRVATSVPTAQTWGLVFVTLLLLASGSYVVRRRALQRR